MPNIKKYKPKKSFPLVTTCIQSNTRGFTGLSLVLVMTIVLVIIVVILLLLNGKLNFFTEEIGECERDGGKIVSISAPCPSEVPVPNPLHDARYPNSKCCKVR